MAFKAGAMGAKSASSTPTEFTNSLASLMEQKLHDLMQAEMGSSPFSLSDNSPDARARRALFVAISQAVLEHLRDHASTGFTLNQVNTDPHRHTVTVVTT